MGIKRAKTKELREIEVSPTVSTLEVEKMYFPPVKKAEMIEGSPEEVAKKLIEILKNRGLV
jgi:electron transfer flavoprotein beta subunit